MAKRKRDQRVKLRVETLESRMMLSAVKSGPPAQLVFSKQPVSGSQLGTVTVAVEDAQGHLVKNDSSKVVLAIQSGPSNAQLTGAVVAFAKKGVATFSAASLVPAGTYILSATDGALSPTVSQAFTIRSSATRLVIIRQPRSILAGAPESVQFALENSAGVIQTSDDSSVTVKIVSGPKRKTLQGTFTVSAVNGIATFSGLILPRTGTYTLSATAGVLKSAATSAFTVSPGAAAFLKIVSTTTNANSAPIRNTTGVVGPIIVNVVDSQGNVVTGDTSTVTLVLNTTLDTETTTGIVTQAETATATVSGGVAVFDSLSSLTPGYYALFLTDSGFSGGVSQLLYVR